MASPSLAFLRRENPIRVDLIVESLKELGPGVRGQLARVSVSVEGVGGELRPQGPFGRR